MRRFVGLLVVLFFSIPFGISVSGCGKGVSIVFCDVTAQSGPIVGQLYTLTLTPQVFGISLNQGAFGQVTPPSGKDCKGTTVTPGAVTYGVVEQNAAGQFVPTTLVDIVPSGTSAGRLCAGTFNRNTGGGVPDYTVCTPNGRTGTAYITAASVNTSSNRLPIFVHPVVTAMTVGAPSTNCATDLATNCCAFSTVGSTTTPNGTFTGNSCLSQNISGQVAARVYAGTGDSLQNITCSRAGTNSSGQPVYTPLVGHLTFTPQDTTVVSIDENGIATAKYPGSTVINATIANGTSVIASSTAGYFSTCPPTSITLTAANVAGSPSTVTVQQNNVQPLTAVAADKNGVVLNGLTLEFVSTTPRTLPNGSGGSVTPIFPGTGDVTAICQPPACNNAPQNQLGLYGNGLPVTSNPLTVNTPGTNSSILYTASTQSLYLSITDFATNTTGTSVRLPYYPNSMVLSTDGNTLYIGSSTELMVASATSGALAGQYVAARGQVLAVSPDNSTVVVTDPTRQTISLVNTSGAITATYGGVGTRAAFSPDSSTVYISAGTQLVVHSTYTGWTSVPLSTAATDVAIGRPSVGAFLAGATTTARGYCPITTVSGTGVAATTSNILYPDAGVAASATQLVSTTNDGVHLLGASLPAGTAVPVLEDFHLTNGANGQPGLPEGACPAAGLRFNASPIGRAVYDASSASTVDASAITGVHVATDSSIAFLTYTGSSNLLPFYIPNGTSAGTPGVVALSGSAGAPVAGILSSDNQTFFVGTAGDGLVHLVTKSSTGYVDTSTLNPKIVSESGTPVPVNLIQQKPRRIT